MGALRFITGIFFSIVFCIFMISLAFFQSAPAASVHPILTLEPQSQIKQGGILLARLTGDATTQSGLTASLDGHKSSLLPVSPGVFEVIYGISVDTPPGEHTLLVMDPTGQEIAKQTFRVLDGRFPRQNISVGKSTAGLKPLPGELEAIQALKTVFSSERFWSRPLMSPTPECENSPFGVKRYHNGVYIHDYHKGVDLRSPAGRPIHTIADGIVKIAAPQFRLHGGTVGLDHGQGLSSVYIHMSKVAVQAGQHVKKGDVIGYVGSTGFATGPHLHWGLYANGVPVNPDFWIPVPRC